MLWKDMIAKTEDFVQFAANPGALNGGADSARRQAVVNDIDNHGAPKVTDGRPRDPLGSSGAPVGCRGELGTACVMAAGAATQFHGGSLRRIGRSPPHGYRLTPLRYRRRPGSSDSR